MLSSALRGTVPAALLSLALPVLADSHSRHFDNVLGTSMDLSIVGVRSAEADKAFAAAATEAARLEALLSDYRPDSEVSRLNRDRTLPTLSPELRELIGHCRRWEASTSGAFSCKLGKARAIWQQAVSEDAVPDRRALRAMARQLRSTELPEPADGAYKLPDVIELDINGLAKGYVIDKVLAAMRGAAPTASGIKVDIGGDGLYSGRSPDDEPWQVGLTDANTDRAAPNGVVAVQNLAVAASGHHARGMTIRRRQFSHILATRDAWPTQPQVASYVMAPTAITADVVATLAASLAPSDSLEWIGAQADIEALLVLPSGRQIASAGWRQSEVLNNAGPMPQLSVTYEIPKVKAGKYRRPYVALWITNADRQPIRHLLLLGDSQRWAQENRRWWRAAGRDDSSLLDGYARSTRRPGTYTVRWDGRDDRGQPVVGNQFRLHLEAAREHGGHTYQTIDIDFSTPASETLTASGEFGDISVRWHRDGGSNTKTAAVQNAPLR
ncbi:MAG: DUF2271 domain-containing protein [Pseudomonadota bacterium]